MTIQHQHHTGCRRLQAIFCALVALEGAAACGNSIAPEHSSRNECDADTTRIHDVQGAFESSPIVGEAVTIEGVVVGTFPGVTGLGGFFVQEQDDQTDNRANTSEGLFVYAGDLPINIKLGDIVRVKGTVSEYRGLTELNDIVEVRTCSTGANVTPTTVSLPFESTAHLEALEGMLVQFSQTLHVTDTYHLGRHGRVTLSSAAHPFQPTNRVAPGAEALALQSVQERSRVELDDGSNVEFPTLPPYLGPGGTVRLGDSIEGLLGVLGNAFGTYQLHPLAVNEAIRFTRDNPRPVAPFDPSGSLRVASFNLANYFTTIDSGESVCGPQGKLDCRGADSQAEFTRQRTKILAALASMSADVVGLIELENDANVAILDLIHGLDAQMGSGTYSFIDTGVIGTDSIKVGLIYKVSKLAPVGGFALLDSSVDPSFDDTLNRPALAQTFEQRSNGERFTLVVNHWKSKGSQCSNDPDMNDGQGNCNLTRTRAAFAEIAWLASGPTGGADADFLVLGDLNSYAMEDPITAITQSGFVNLVALYVGRDAYSYSFDGLSGTLDHAFSSPSLGNQVVGAQQWHINADEPQFRDYNQEYNPPTLYSPDPFRSSDHDPLIVGLKLGSHQ